MTATDFVGETGLVRAIHEALAESGWTWNHNTETWRHDTTGEAFTGAHATDHAIHRQLQRERHHLPPNPR